MGAEDDLSFCVGSIDLAAVQAKELWHLLHAVCMPGCCTIHARPLHPTNKTQQQQRGQRRGTSRHGVQTPAITNKTSALLKNK